MTDKIAVDRDFLEHAIVALEYAYSADDEMVQESIKYLRAALAAQPAEAVAWRKTERMYHEYEGSAKDDNVGYLVTRYSDTPNPGWEPLYAAQPAPAAVPLTEEQIRDLAKESGLDWHRGYMPLFDDDDDPTNRYEVFARAVLAAAGEKPHWRKPNDR